MSVETPIPLTVFEKYFLLDASEEFPMICDGSFHFTGIVDRDVFQEAVQDALKRQPLLTRKIKKRRRRFYWVPVQERFEIVQLETPPDVNCQEWNRPFDLFTTNGLELYACVNEMKTEIYYRCHHLCTDGTGIFRFFSDVFTEYAKRCGQPIAERFPLRPERIADRNNFPPSELPGKISFFRILYDTVREVVKWLQEKPIPLETEVETVDTTKGRFGRKTYFISMERVDEYRRYAKSQNSNLNDFLMTGLFTALSEQHLVGRQGNRLRMMIPVNMRWPGSEDIPAANILSYVFLTKKKAACRRSRELLTEIHNEMQIIKDWQVGFMFLDALRFFNALPGGLRFMTGGKKCLASLVFSNIGTVEKFFDDDFAHTGDEVGRGILQCGNLRLDRADAYAPCRRRTNLSVVASTQAGNLLIGCLFDRKFISDEWVDHWFDDLKMLLDKHVSGDGK